MALSKKVKLENRPDDITPCKGGCGEMAKVDSDYCSIECRERFHGRMRTKIRNDNYIPLEEKHVSPDSRTWDERWNSIYAKYGVNRKLYPNRTLEA